MKLLNQVSLVSFLSVLLSFSSISQSAENKTDFEGWQQATKSVRVLATAPNAETIKKIKVNLSKIDKSIDLTKTRIKSPQDVEFLPDLYFSLAELYLDKSRLMYSLKLEMRLGSTSDELDFTAEKRVKQEAIDIYTTIKDRFLQFGQRDRVLFVLGSELKEMGDSDTALKVFKELLEKYPQSSYWEKSQLSVGNIFYDKKDFEFAKQQYLKILARDEKPIFSFIQFKVGQCEIYLDHFLDSMLAFEKAVQIAKKYNLQISKNDNEVENIKEDALIASVWPMLELSPAQQSQFPRFLKPLSYYLSLADDKALFRRVLMRLARRMIVKNRDFEAAQVYFEILRSADDPEMKREGLEGYYLKMKSAKKDYYPESTVTVLRDTLRSFKLQNIDYKKYEPLYRDIATSVHRLGQSSKRSSDLLNAVTAYRDYLHFFPTSKFKKDIQVNTAEALYQSGKLIESGIEFSALAEANTPVKNKKDYISSALKALSENFAKSADNTVLERAQGRILYRQVANQFLKAYPKDSEAHQIVFNVAKTYYDEKDFKSAVPQLKKFLVSFPQSRHNQEAALLLLDTYFTRDDLKGLVQEGKNILAIQGLESSLRKKVQDIMQQSQLKDLKNLAGEFGSKDYATKILQFARTNKASQLGETALFEAFVSLRSGQDEKLFAVGEDFLGSFPNSAKSKEVLLSMTQAAVTTVDFSRATKYLVAFAQKFPQDPQSNNFMSQATSISEQIGDYDEAISGYRSTNQLDKVATLLEKSGNWSELLKLAPQLGSTKSLYFSGVANLNLNKKAEALSLFRRLMQQGATVGNTVGTASEKEWVAQAGFRVAENDLTDFSTSLKTTPFTPQNLTAKVTQHQEIERALQNIMTLGSGPWTIGALYLSGKLNSEMTNFLKTAKPPVGMAAEKLAGILAPQIKNYSTLAMTSFSKCAQVAEENDVFTEAVNACRVKSLSFAMPASTTLKKNRGIASVSPEISSARKALYQSPKDVKTLNNLVTKLVQSGNYKQAFATQSRLIEIEPANSSRQSEVGVLYLYLNDIDLAVTNFKETLKKNSQDQTALWGLTAVYKKFGFSRQYEKYFVQAKAVGRPQGLTHPWMKL